MARDSQGIIITMMAQNLPRCFSVLAMEAQAVIQGLYFARKCDLSPVEIKTDSQQVVLKVLSTNEDRSPAGDFIRPIRDSLAGFHPQVVMSYANRRANGVTDCLAAMGSHLLALKIWM